MKLHNQTTHVESILFPLRTPSIGLSEKEIRNSEELFSFLEGHEQGSCLDGHPNVTSLRCHSMKKHASK